MGTWWNTRRGRTKVFTDCWTIVSIGLWIYLFVFQPDFDFANPKHFGVLAMLCGYTMYAPIVGIWLSTLFLFFWMVASFFLDSENIKIGFAECWLISGIVVAAILILLTNQYMPYQRMLWFVIGTCIGWYGPVAWVVWFLGSALR